jgi:hypothetical protein
MVQLKPVYPTSDEDTNALPVKDLGTAISATRRSSGSRRSSLCASTALLTRDGVRIGLVREGDQEPSRARSVAFEVDHLEAIHGEDARRSARSFSDIGTRGSPASWVFARELRC